MFSKFSSSMNSKLTGEGDVGVQKYTLSLLSINMKTNVVQHVKSE